MAKDTTDTGEAAAPSAADEAVDAPKTAELSGETVSYRVLPKGDDLVFTGQHDKARGEPGKHPRGAIVHNVDRTIAQELEDRGLVEIVG